MKVTVKWSQKANISVLIANVEDVNYPISGEYIDDSKAILNEIGVIDDEGDDDDADKLGAEELKFGRN